MTHRRPLKTPHEALIRNRCLELLRQRRQGFGQTWKAVKRQLPRGANETAVLLEMVAALAVENTRPAFTEALYSLPVQQLEFHPAGRAITRSKRLLRTLITRGLHAEKQRPATRQDVDLIQEALRQLGTDSPDDNIRRTALQKTIAKLETEIARAGSRRPA